MQFSPQQYWSDHALRKETRMKKPDAKYGNELTRTD
jgi:hypothetical protein